MRPDRRDPNFHLHVLKSSALGMLSLTRQSSSLFYSEASILAERETVIRFRRPWRESVWETLSFHVGILHFQPDVVKQPDHYPPPDTLFP